VNQLATAELLRLEPSPAAPRLARQRVRDVFTDLPDDQQAVILLLTSELVTNAVEHPVPPGGGRREDIEVHLYRTERLLRVEITDDDPRPLPPPRRPSALSENGMGLMLVANLATRWGSDATDDGHGKVAWFELLVSAGPDQQ
jgi:two-component sensor histidine kinase